MFLRAGDPCFVALLPWLTRCFGTMQRPHGIGQEASIPAAAASKDQGFALVQLFGSALAALMQDASKRDDLGAWTAGVDAWCDVLLEAHRHDLCRAPGQIVSVFLGARLLELFQQQGRFQSAQAAAAAGGVLRALLDIDVRLLEDRLPDVWFVLMKGASHAQAGCVRAACDLVVAFGETRLLPKLLVAATTALCDCSPSDAASGLGVLQCAPELSKAWSLAVEKLPAMQFPEVLLCVRDCLAQAEAAGMFGPRSALACLAAPLAEVLSAAVAGTCATPEASSALVSAAVELQKFAESLLDKGLPPKSRKLVSDGGVALCLRICTCVASVVHACAACTSNIGVPLSVPEQCDSILCGCLERLAPWLASRERKITPWCELEAARAALLLRTWEYRDNTASRVPVCHLARLSGGSGCLNITKQVAWDGVFSTVTAEMLPCAFWQLATEHMATL